MADQIGPAIGGDAVGIPSGTPAIGGGGFGDYAIGSPGYGAGPPFAGFGGGGFSGVGLTDMQIGTGVGAGIGADAFAGQAANPIAGADRMADITKAGVSFVDDRSKADIIIDDKGAAEIVSNTPHGVNNTFNIFRENKDMSQDTLTAGLKDANQKLEAAKSPFRVNEETKLPTVDGKDDDDDDKEDQPKEPGGGGGGGGGGGEQPKDDPKEDKEDPEDKADADKGSNDKSTSNNIINETMRQLDRNTGMSFANLASYAGGLWNGSMLSSLFSQYDKDEDGKLDAEEMAAMKADPQYQGALDEMKNKIGNDPGLADFKNNLDSAAGLSALNQLQSKGANAQAADVDKVFNPAAKSAISKLAVSQELQSAGLKASDPIPTDFESKVKPIIDKLVNGKHVFTF